MQMSDNGTQEASFRPSDYTAALVQVIRETADQVRGARVLDVGCGSGVLLAAAASVGAVHLSGVDIEKDAVEATRRLLSGLGLGGASDISQGAMFAPVAGRRFDLVLANLPHFPMSEGAVDGRLASWSSGGPNGRRLMDSFLSGLKAHLATGGRALVMHNHFIGLETTHAIAAQNGLAVTRGKTILVPVPKAKLAVMTPDVLEREIGRSIHILGQHAFGTVEVLIIRPIAEGGEP